MTKTHIASAVDIGSFGFAATMRGNDVDGYTIEADVDQATLDAAAKAAPVRPPRDPAASTEQ